MHKRLLIILISLFIFSSCDSDSNTANSGLTIDEKIQGEIRSLGIPSLVSCIIKNNTIVWSGVYGNADIENNISATLGTNYTLASVSKLVILTAIMQIWEQGRISLEADINEYLPLDIRNPNYPNEPITIYMLLTHRSTIAHPSENEIPTINFYEYFPGDTAPQLNEWLPELLIPGGTLYHTSVWHNSRPGELERYSNIATSLLASIVENITGMSFNDYCKQYIFTPLDMPNTNYWLAELNVDNVAIPYDTGLHRFYHYSFYHHPTGCLRSSVNEFSHLLIAYLSGGIYGQNRILQESTITKILEVQNTASGVCYIWNYFAGDWYGHSGGMRGGATYVEIQPDSHLGIIIFTNTSPDSQSSIFFGGSIHSIIREHANTFR